eukprot:284815121_5
MMISNLLMLLLVKVCRLKMIFHLIDQSMNLRLMLLDYFHEKSLLMNYFALGVEHSSNKTKNQKYTIIILRRFIRTLRCRDRRLVVEFLILNRVLTSSVVDDDDSDDDEPILISVIGWFVFCFFKYYITDFANEKTFKNLKLEEYLIKIFYFQIKLNQSKASRKILSIVSMNFNRKIKRNYFYYYYHLKIKIKIIIIKIINSYTIFTTTCITNQNEGQKKKKINFNIPFAIGMKSKCINRTEMTFHSKFFFKNMKK